MSKSLRFSCWPDKGLLGQQENRSDFDIFAWSPQKCQNHCSFPVGPVSPYRANRKTAVNLTFLRISPLPSWPSPWLPQKWQNHCSFPVGPDKPLSGPTGKPQWFWHFLRISPLPSWPSPWLPQKWQNHCSFACWPGKGLLGQQENRSDFDIFAWSPQKCQNHCSFPVGPVSPYRANRKTAVILTFLRISPLPSWPSPWSPQKCQNHCSFPVGPDKPLSGPTRKLQRFWHFCASHLCPRGHRLDYLKNVKITAVFLLAR